MLQTLCSSSKGSALKKTILWHRHSRSIPPLTATATATVTATAASFHQTPVMKFHYSVCCAAALTGLGSHQTCAWVPSSTLSSSSRYTAADQFRYASLLQSTAAAPEETANSSNDPTPLIPSGVPIVEGKVVSILPGGLYAVNVDVEEVKIVAKAEEKPVALPKDIAASIFPKAEKKMNRGGDLTGRQVILPDQTVGVVVAHRPPIAFVYSGRQNQDFKDDGVTQVLDSLASVSVYEDTKIVDCFGRNVVESVGSQDAILSRPIFATIPQIKDIALINTPMVTGVTMFDALAPIGNGQNMLMIGHNLEDMRGYVRDILSAQKLSKRKCIYAVTSDTEDVKKLLAEAGISDNVTLVVPNEKAKASDKNKAAKAAEATIICATACAIGEAYALEQGEDALVIVDNIDQHKTLWGATTQVLVDVFGVEAVVKSDREGGASSEMRAFYSSLIQRSAQYKEKRGGGSVTLLMLTTIPKMASADEDTVFAAEDFQHMGEKLKERINMLVGRKIPLTAATLRKVNIPIPSDSEGRRRQILQHVDDLISMSDGQIWLDETLEGAGRKPAMDPQRSVTRVGIGADTNSRPDTPAMRRVVEGLRLNLAQVACMDGAEGTNVSMKEVRKANALLLAMHQPSGKGGRKLSESCTAVLAASNGYLNDVVEKGVTPGSEEGDQVMADMLAYIRAEASDAMAQIDTTLDMPEEVQADIEKALTSFFKK